MEANRKRCKVIMLPTENNVKGGICQGVDKQLYPTYSHPENNMYRNFNLYITSDEEIKEGDWIFETDLNTINQAGKDYNFGFGIKHDRKIIATTDSKLIKCDYCGGTGVLKDKLQNPSCHFDFMEEPILEDEPCEDCEILPQPSKAFIEKYCKVGGIDEVDVEGVFIKFPLRYGIEAEKIYFEPKVDSHNTITIHAIKDSWNREEVKTLLFSLADELYAGLSDKSGIEEFNNWIKENL